MDEVETALDLFQEYLRENVSTLHKEFFNEEMFYHVTLVMKEQFGDVDDSIYFHALRQFHGRVSYMVTPEDTHVVDAKLYRLRSLPQMEQRSQEWHAFRHKLITASSAYKALGSEAKQRELLKSKQNPYEVTYTDDSGPRHWGVKYEPLSCQYYSYVYRTRIEEFGCLVHPKYPCLAASPDGMNVDPSSPLYGRLVEIKNPFSREMNGNPKEEYWVQCQLQMEVCDVEWCDFLETKFVEYESEEAFNQDGTFLRTKEGHFKGVFLQVFTDKLGYVYPPFQGSEEAYKEWEMANMNDAWRKTVYWKLEEVSLVTIRRNREWFEYALPQWLDFSKRITS
jgi:putative phage-type endonuclease